MIASHVLLEVFPIDLAIEMGLFLVIARPEIRFIGYLHEVESASSFPVHTRALDFFQSLAIDLAGLDSFISLDDNGFELFETKNRSYPASTSLPNPDIYTRKPDQVLPADPYASYFAAMLFL